MHIEGGHLREMDRKMDNTPMTHGGRKWHHPPLHLWLGLALVAICWPLNWCMQGMRTHLLFVPLWLGYCLSVDALVASCKGSSPLTRGGWAYGWLFVLSVPAWWLFETINLRTQNWQYLGREEVSTLAYVVLASLSFSTVMPAVFTSAELVGCALHVRRESPPERRMGQGALVAVLPLGCVMLGLVLLLPKYFFPLVWLSLFLIVDPINAWTGRNSLLLEVGRGNWRQVWALWGGVMLCALFWEMWNYWSYPKWIYQVPFVGRPRLFEMPVLGYLGYLPFAMELYALFHLAKGTFRLRGAQRLLEL